MKIKLSDIHPASEPVRTSIDQDKLEELKRSIASEGLIVPIKVQQNLDGYEVIYGHRRLEAMRQLGIDEVNAEVVIDTQVLVDSLDDEDTKWQALLENIDREDPDDMDTANALMERKLAGYSDEEIARRCGWVAQHVRSFLAMARAPEPVREVLLTGQQTGMDKITQRHFMDSSALHKEPEMRAAVLQKAKDEGLGVRQTRKIAKSVAATKDPKRRRMLFETPYSSFIHDPEINQDRAERFGAYDPTSASKEPTQGDEWRELPEVKALLDLIQSWTKRVPEIKKTVEAGKFAPEAKPFLDRRIDKLISRLQDLQVVLREPSDD
jgi:ParB/RepB/Spo0J family partition protein